MGSGTNLSCRTRVENSTGLCPETAALPQGKGTQGA